ncbi:MAG: hypothetical protein AB7E85_06440 [Pseudobdellovibrionaceae bacterium]
MSRKQEQAFSKASQVRHGQMFLGPGAAIDPESIRCLNVRSLEDFKVCEESDNQQLQAIAKSVAAHAPKGLDIKYADIKSDVRTVTKAEREKEGDYSRITDRVRLSLIIPDNGYTEKTIAYLANRFTPRNDSRVLHIEDAFIRPNKDNHQRRLKILYRMDSGSVGEIMVTHEGMTRSNVGSLKHRNQLRAIEDFLVAQGGNIQRNSNIKRLCRAYEESCQNRKAVTDEGARACGISQFEIRDEERRFFIVEDTNGEIVPTLLMPDPYHVGRPLVAVRPDYARGTYVVDNSLLPIVTAEKLDTDRVMELDSRGEITPRDQFITMAQEEYINYQKNNGQYKYTPADAVNDTGEEDDGFVAGIRLNTAALG